MKSCIKCGSYALNLARHGIDQGNLCDVHYWQERAIQAEQKLTDESVAYNKGFNDGHLAATGPNKTPEDPWVLTILLKAVGCRYEDGKVIDGEKVVFTSFSPYQNDRQLFWLLEKAKISLVVNQKKGYAIALCSEPIKWAAKTKFCDRDSVHSAIKDVIWRLAFNIGTVKIKMEKSNEVKNESI